MELNLDISTLLAVLIALYTVYAPLKLKRNDTYVKEKYEFVVFPIFQLLEPFIYKKIDSDIKLCIQDIYKVIIENRMYVSGSLLDIVDYCIKKMNDEELNQDDYNLLCQTICDHYDKSCKKLGLQKRTYTYKRRNCQLSSSKKEVEKEIRKFIVEMLSLFFSAVVFTTIFLIAKLILDFIIWIQ